MHIIVPIKQVPESSNVKMDPETGTMIRTGIQSVVNPLDLYAVESALELKRRYGGSITVISMGPPDAHRAIREIISMGCDRGILLSDKRYSGSDTWATSYVLSRGIMRCDPFDLILCGERATDGDTGQVGPGIAAWLGLPVVSYVSHIHDLHGKHIDLERLVEEGYQQVRASLPAVMTVVKEIARPQLPTLKGKIRARKIDIPVWSLEDIKADPAKVGLKGSPTRVVRIEQAALARNGRLIHTADEQSMDAALNILVDYIKDIDV